ncbi:MAG: hypothetical protein ACTSW1_09910 [Candidatus Hodarchaeales archaeon]
MMSQKAYLIITVFLINFIFISFQAETTRIISNSDLPLLKGNKDPLNNFNSKESNPKLGLQTTNLSSIPVEAFGFVKSYDISTTGEPISFILRANHDIHVAFPSNQCVKVFSTGAEFGYPQDLSESATMGTLNEAGTDNDHFSQENLGLWGGMAVTHDYFFVSDGENKRIQVFHPHHHTYMTTINCTGYDDGEVRGLSVDKDNNLYAVVNDSVIKFNNEFQYTGSIITNLSILTNVAVLSNGTKLIGTENGTIEVYDEYNTRKEDLKSANSYPFSNITLVRTDRHDNLYIISYNQHRIQVQDKNRRFIAEIGIFNESGTDSLHLDHPVDVCYLDGFIYVLEQTNAVIKVYQAPSSWFIESELVIQDETILLNNSITITSNGNLTLVNSTLLIGDKYPYMKQIIIQHGGILLLRNGSKITTVSGHPWMYQIMNDADPYGEYGDPLIIVHDSSIKFCGVVDGHGQSGSGISGLRSRLDFRNSLFYETAIIGENDDVYVNNSFIFEDLSRFPSASLLDIWGSNNYVEGNYFKYSGNPEFREIALRINTPYCTGRVNNVIKNNKIISDKIGILFPFAEGNVLEGNIITAEKQAVLMPRVNGDPNQAEVIIKSNYLQSGFDFSTIKIQGNPLIGLQFVNNTIIGNNNEGLFEFENVESNYLEQSEFCFNVFRNEHGNPEVTLDFRSSKNILFYYNEFQSKGTDYITIQNSTDIDFSHEGFGNYWPDYTGVDLDQDDVGDSSYQINENFTDDYPLMYHLIDYQEFRVDHLSDRIISSSSSNQKLIWHAFCANPKNYSLFENGAVLENETNWDGISDISVNLEGKLNGTYIYELVLYNTTDFTRRDIVEVQIVNIPAPEVQVTYPNGGEMVNGTIKIIWERMDSNGLDVKYSVLYSADAGGSWHILVESITFTNYYWDTTLVEDGYNYLIKVVIRDDYQENSDVSDNLFTVKNRKTSTMTSETNTTDTVTTTTTIAILYTSGITPGFTIGPLLFSLVVTIIMIKKRR